MLLWLECAREGLRDEIAFEQIRFRRDGRRRACGVGEHVNELENEESWERATKVGDAGVTLAHWKIREDRRLT
jgi:hypothetical protein